eukprot:COSAG02_NODE_1884_length_10516_cov_4.173466_2_plen_90_part_00
MIDHVPHEKFHTRHALMSARDDATRARARAARGARRRVRQPAKAGSRRLTPTLARGGVWSGWAGDSSQVRCCFSSCPASQHCCSAVLIF